MTRARFRLVRIDRRRARLAAMGMRRAGHPLHHIARALGLKRATVALVCRGVGQGLWSPAEIAMMRRAA